MNSVKVLVSLTLSTPDPDHPLNGSVLEGQVEVEIPKRTRKMQVKKDTTRLDHIWVERACYLFQQVTEIPWNREFTGSEFAVQWRKPLMDLQKKILIRGDVWKDNMPSQQRWTEESLYALGFCLIDTRKAMDARDLDYSSPQSMQKTASYAIGKRDYYYRAVRYMQKQGTPRGPITPRLENDEEE